MKNDIYTQIRNITLKLIQTNISISQNFPCRVGDEVVWENYKNLAFTLKERPYDEVYSALIDNKDYNFLLLDGGIIQLKYTFKNNNLTKQILSFYPTPNHLKFIDNPENFEEIDFGRQLFNENIHINSFGFPIRFDFGNSDFVELDHPYSHATLGNYESCRIPIAGPVSPLKFVGFILRSFYFEKFKEAFESGEFFSCPLAIPRSITSNEQKVIHFSY